MSVSESIPDGVGRTALFIAMARATESRRPDAWFHDRLAGAFLAAAGGPSAVSDRAAAPSEDDILRWHAFSDYVAVRTRFFDEALSAAAADGCRQVVIPGAGLDARAFRLDWPDGTRFFEIDSEPVFRFKDAVVRGAGASPRCARTTVVADLREDWERRLLDAGFRADRPSAWLAEGLLIYLPPAGADAVLETAARLAAPGSRFAFEHVSAARLEAMKSAADGEWGARSRFADLWQSGLSEPPAHWCARFGWDADVTNVGERARAWGRAVAGPMTESLFLVRATRAAFDDSRE